MSALSARNVTVSIGTKQIVRDATLGLDAGELVTLVGPNGAGKTTLMRALAGLVPAQGSIALADKPLGRRKLLALPAFFCFVNAAALRAAWNLARGRQIDRWEPRRAMNWESVEGQTGVPVRSPE